MTEEKPAGEIDITKAWAASQNQKGAAKRLRIYAALCWVVAIGAEVAGIVLLKQGKFSAAAGGNLPLLIGILVAIAVFAIGGSLLWKKANTQDPASRSEPFRFFVQNQLGAIITVLAFLPLLVLIFLDKDMDPKNKKIAGGVGVALALLATVIGIDFKPPSVEQYTQDMNSCAAQIQAGQPTTACSPEVAEQAQAIARDTQAVADATKSAANPNGLNVVYWIAPENGAAKSDTAHVFHLCEAVSPLKGKTVNHGNVTEAYAQNATRITKQIGMEQKQCGMNASAAPVAEASSAG
jgi:hypothetical protein